MSFITVPASVRPSKIPGSLIVDGVDLMHDFNPSTARTVPGCPEWSREVVTAPSAVAIRWNREQDGLTMLDLKSRLTDRLTPIVVDGVADFVRPLAGRAWSSWHPTTDRTVATSVGDPIFRELLSRPTVDHLLVHEGGSPREGAFDFVRRIVGREGGLSDLGAEYLGCFTAEQVNRDYQDSDARGLSCGLTGVAHVVAKGAGADAFLGLPYWAGHCPCHLTIERLATAYLLTGSPRALDQLVSLVTHAFRTEYYLELEADRYGRVAVNGFYNDTPRMIGWPLVVGATFLDVMQRVSKTGSSGAALATLLGPGVVRFLEVHIANVLDHWGPGVWSPFETSLPNGGHTKDPHDVPFMHVPLIVGARRLAGYGVRGAKRLEQLSLDFVENHCVDTAAPGVAFYYDALKAGGGVGSRALSNGVGTWFIAAFAGTGRKLELRMIEESFGTNRFGVPDIDFRNTLTPGLDWIPEGWGGDPP